MARAWLTSIAQRLRAAVPVALVLLGLYACCAGTHGHGGVRVQGREEILVYGDAYGFPLPLLTSVSVSPAGSDPPEEVVASRVSYLPPESVDRSVGVHVSAANLLNLLIVSCCALALATLVQLAFGQSRR